MKMSKMQSSEGLINLLQKHGKMRKVAERLEAIRMQRNSAILAFTMC